MTLTLRVEGHPGEAFARVIRSLPDGRSWLLSDLEGRVVIARSEGEEILREAILSLSDDGTTWDVECLASRGVSELTIMALVALAILSSIATLVWVWTYGPPGFGGLVYGLVLALTVPAGVITIGRRVIDPGREPRAERNLERAMRFAIAQVPGVTLLNTDG